MIRQNCEQLASAHVTAINIVLLPGWSFDREIWRECLGQLRQWANVTLLDLSDLTNNGEDLDTVIEEMLLIAPMRAVYIGWSLGGCLATRLAAKYPDRVDALITLATNPRFITSADWPDAMPQYDFKKFNKLVENSHSAGLKLFDSLQTKGENDPTGFRQWLKKKRSSRTADLDLLIGLKWLKKVDNRGLLAKINCPTLHIFAEQDALVPVGVAGKIQRFNPDHQVKIIRDTGHALLWNRSENLLECWEEFLKDQLKPMFNEHYIVGFDKQLIAKSFSKAADTYDSAASLQRQVGERLLEYFGHSMKEVKISSMKNQTILDLGSGTGYFSKHLQAQHNTTYIGFDIAEGMLNFSNAKLDPKLSWCCGDAENLPFCAESIDVIFSSLTIQWCNHLSALFSEVWRTLKPGGIFLFSTLGPETLKELREAWSVADDYVHVNNFSSFDTLEQLIDQQNFTDKKLVMQKITIQYNELKELTGELKNIGAHNINQGRQLGLTSRAKLRMFKEAYENQRIDDFLPATYQVYYGVLKK